VRQKWGLGTQGIGKMEREKEIKKIIIGRNRERNLRERGGEGL